MVKITCECGTEIFCFPEEENEVVKIYDGFTFDCGKCKKVYKIQYVPVTQNMEYYFNQREY